MNKEEFRERFVLEAEANGLDCHWSGKTFLGETQVAWNWARWGRSARKNDSPAMRELAKQIRDGGPG